jgi:hypothetical protein
MIPQRKIIVLFLALLLGISACGSDDSQSTATITTVPPPLCAAAYNQAVDACVAASGCGGFGCIYTYGYCSSGDGQRALTACCSANYSGTDVTTCTENYGYMN